MGLKRALYEPIREAGKSMPVKLIYFTGLNCFSAGLITVAALWGLDYPASFAALWSETELFYDPIHRCYLTRRMPAALAVMGLALSAPLCHAQGERGTLLATLREGSFILVEMDAFDIPWSPACGVLHDRHYFLARREGARTFTCFDPTYQLQGMTLTHDALFQGALDLRVLHRSAGVAPPTDPAREARALSVSHPRLTERLLDGLAQCARGDRARAIDLARYIDALIQNRRLFLRHLSFHAPGAACLTAFDRPFFARWEAVKNGLYKAALKQENEASLGDVRALFLALMQEELALAEVMAAAASSPC